MKAVILVGGYASRIRPTSYYHACMYACVICGKNFKPSSKRKRKTCSRECWIKLMKSIPHTKEWNEKVSKNLMGHPPAIPKGSSRPLEVRLKISKAKLGHPVSSETRQKISVWYHERIKRGWRGGMTGKKHSLQSRRKMSESLKGRKSWNKGKRGIYSKETLKKIRLARLNQKFPKESSIEKMLQKGLESRECKFETHLSVCGICQPDIVFADQKMVVFCDGDYWHNLPEYIKRDQKQNEILKKSGWTVLRFWEHEIRQNLQKCVDQVVGVLSN